MNKVYLDGYNFILRNSALARLFRSDQDAARERLKSILQDYAARKKVKITVVYDSREKPIGEGTVTSYYLYEEIFVNDADAYLRNISGRSRAPRMDRITIVSSDYSDVYLPAKGRGAAVLSCEEFYSEILKLMRKKDTDQEKPSPPTSKEIEDWLRYFETGED